jgi:hypothetical protein
MPQCKAITISGERCRNNAIHGTSYCYISSHGSISKTFRQRFWNFLLNERRLAVAALLLTIIGMYSQRRVTELSATSGILSSPARSTSLSVSVGSAEFQMLSKDGVVFDEGGDPLLSIRLQDGRLLATTRVRDGSGNLIGEMVDNEWKHQNQPAIFDRNYTQDVLEIRDKTGRVALQVANTGNTIDVAAIFHCKNGWTYMAGPTRDEGSVIELRPPGESLHSEIPEICDYPSELHFGSCPGIQRLKEMTRRPHAIYPLHFPPHLCIQQK